jgi:hypothetical protein
LNGFLVTRQFFRLVVGSIWSADFRTFVPVQAKPSKALQYWCERFGNVALLVGVINAEDELAFVFARKEPIGLGAKRVRIIACKSSLTGQDAAALVC